jgi:outer membrane lipoprotein-sorting protein
MRRSVRPLASTTLALVVATIGAIAAAYAQTPPTVDALIAKNLQAKGGEAKLKSVQSMKMSGKVSIQGMEVPMMIFAKRPNLMRQEMQIQDKRVVTAFDGDKAWMINPFMGSETPQELTGPQADMTKDQADFDGALMDYKSKGHTIELVGSEDVGGAKTHKLKVTKKGGQIQYFYLDADSGIEVKTATQVEQSGKTITVETELSDYRPIDGIMLPHALKNSMNGQPVGSIVVEKIELNAQMDPSQFRMPGK